MAPKNGKMRFNFKDGYNHPICRRSDKKSNSKSGKKIKITKTITVKKGEVFDGKGATYYGDKKKMGDGSQGENQKPLFDVFEGATLRNLKIDKSGADGVHCRGKGCLIEHVTWKDVGEDAVSSKGPKGKKGSGKVKNPVQIALYKCKFYKAEDKALQSSNRCDWVLLDCYFEDCDNCFLSNFSDNVFLINCEYKDCGVMVQVNELNYDKRAGSKRHLDLWYYNIKGKNIHKKKYGKKSWAKDFLRSLVVRDIFVVMN